MAKNKDLISKRLAAITNASPVDWKGASAKQRPKRVEQRQTVFRFARVILGDRSQVKCIIKDVSARGAKIVLEGAHPLPSRITLKIDQTGQVKPAAVVWQKELEAGLAFEF
ncbi:MAG: PilZ domain-containing protein [Parvularculaceae bacterium]